MCSALYYIMYMQPYLKNATSSRTMQPLSQEPRRTLHMNTSIPCTQLSRLTFRNLPRWRCLSRSYGDHAHLPSTLRSRSFSLSNRVCCLVLDVSLCPLKASFLNFNPIEIPKPLPPEAQPNCQGTPLEASLATSLSGSSGL